MSDYFQKAVKELFLCKTAWVIITERFNCYHALDMTLQLAALEKDCGDDVLAMLLDATLTRERTRYDDVISWNNEEDDFGVTMETNTTDGVHCYYLNLPRPNQDQTRRQWYVWAKTQLNCVLTPAPLTGGKHPFCPDRALYVEQWPLDTIIPQSSHSFQAALWDLVYDSQQGSYVTLWPSSLRLLQPSVASVSPEQARCTVSEFIGFDGIYLHGMPPALEPPELIVINADTSYEPVLTSLAMVLATKGILLLKEFES